MMTKVFVLQRGRDIWGQLCGDTGQWTWPRFITQRGSSSGSGPAAERVNNGANVAR